MHKPLHWHAATVRGLHDLSPSVREFELRPEGGALPWTVGSHLDVQVRIDAHAEPRSYSLVGLPTDADGHEVYRIAVKRAEPGRGGSRFMWSLERGAELAIGEPRNHFPLTLGAPRHLVLAGGIGITPLLGMALTLHQRGADVQVRYAARSTGELVYRDRLATALGDRLRTFADDAGPAIDLDAEVAHLPAGALMWVCGPLPLLDAARAAWARAGRPAADLRFETFGNTGAHAAQPFWVELPRHGLRIEVPADQTLLDALGAAGVDVLSECRRGECGLCAMDIVGVQGTLDHRDVFLSERQRREGRSLCACVSRVIGGGVTLDTSYRADA
jgi:ferredoxin-NADP reductase